MALDRLASLLLRAAELAFGAIVAGVNGEFLDKNSGVDSWTIGRYIYAEVVAGIAIFFSLIWLIPFSSTFLHWPIDIIISLCWWAVFGLLVDVSILPRPRITLRSYTTLPVHMLITRATGSERQRLRRSLPMEQYQSPR